MATVLVTNASFYAGPGAVSALAGNGCVVLCTDPSFADDADRAAFEAAHPHTRALRSLDPDDVHREVLADWGEPDAVVFNDAYPITKNPVEEIPISDFRATFESVVVAPVRLAQLVLPGMKRRGRGSLVFVTSARENRPEPGYAVPTSLRAATTAFAKAVAQEVAPFGIQSNVVAPNYLYSETYYPEARFIDDPAGRALIAQTVPFGRLGTADEVGALIAFLASGASPFTTGQVISFAGGWA